MPSNQNAHKNRARGMSPHETFFTWRYQNGKEEIRKEKDKEEGSEKEGSKKESNEEEGYKEKGQKESQEESQEEKVGLRIVKKQIESRR